MTTLTRLTRRAAATLALATVALLGTAGASEAGTIYTSGRPGPVSVGQVDCRHKVWGASSVLQLTLPTPSIYAHNYRAGAGNDGAYVRYMFSIVDLRTGQSVLESNVSGWSYAWDNQPASFAPGWPVYNLDGRGQYVVRYAVEWRAPGGTSALGVLVHQADRYKYVNHASVEGGIWPACSRVYW